jgi:ABC-type oligopeptide transport system ATPase subunit
MNKLSGRQGHGVYIDCAIILNQRLIIANKAISFLDVLVELLLILLS